MPVDPAAGLLGKAALLLRPQAPLAGAARGLGRHAFLRDVVEADEPLEDERSRARGLEGSEQRQAFDILAFEAELLSREAGP